MQTEPRQGHDHPPPRPFDCRPNLCAMPLVVDAAWAVWSITAGVYDYFKTSAMEERIHALEELLSLHQLLIAGLSTGLGLLLGYVLLRKR
ncbi:unnamed protein product [Arctogadus glacialis]